MHVYLFGCVSAILTLDLWNGQNVCIETEGREGNATNETLASLGEIRVELFDTSMEKKWREARKPSRSNSSTPTQFAGESVSVTEGECELTGNS